MTAQASGDCQGLGREQDDEGKHQVGSGQVGTGQVGTVQVGTGQVGTGQVGTGQVGTGQVGTGQVAKDWEGNRTMRRARTATTRRDLEEILRDGIEGDADKIDAVVEELISETSRYEDADTRALILEGQIRVYFYMGLVARVQNGVVEVTHVRCS